jgi:HNH endonuclease
VRVDPGIWRDTDFADRLTLTSRAVWFDSLFYIAGSGVTTGVYPLAELPADATLDWFQVATELVELGLWRPVADGYEVLPYGGCRVLPERRVPIPLAVRGSIYLRDGYRCVECGGSTSLTCDHITPWSRGGSDDESNLQTMCRSCNSRKGARV